MWKAGTPVKLAVVEFSSRMIVEVPIAYERPQIQMLLAGATMPDGHRLCLGDLVEQLHEEEQKANEAGGCFTCHRAKARYIGVPNDDDLDRLIP